MLGLVMLADGWSMEQKDTLEARTWCCSSLTAAVQRDAAHVVVEDGFVALNQGQHSLELHGIVLEDPARLGTEWTP